MFLQFVCCSDLHIFKIMVKINWNEPASYFVRNFTSKGPTSFLHTSGIEEHLKISMFVVKWLIYYLTTVISFSSFLLHSRVDTNDKCIFPLLYHMLNLNCNLWEWTVITIWEYGMRTVDNAREYSYEICITFATFELYY